MTANIQNVWLPVFGFVKRKCNLLKPEMQPSSKIASCTKYAAHEQVSLFCFAHTVYGARYGKLHKRQFKPAYV